MSSQLIVKTIFKSCAEILEKEKPSAGEDNGAKLYPALLEAEIQVGMNILK
jgi:hypothetical protein